MLSRLLVLAISISALGGCAFGQKIDYRQSTIATPVKSSQPVELHVIDQRPYVRSGKNLTFVGRIRGLYYNPFKVYTLSGSPLTADLQEALRNSLARSDVTTIDSYSADAATPGRKLLLVTVREWKMDAYMKIRFDYDLTAAVIDQHGKVIASESAKDSGPVTNVITAGTEALARVVNASAVVDALSSREPTTLAPPLIQPQQKTKPGSASEYDACMKRVARISDPSLRRSSMSICDDAP